MSTQLQRVLPDPRPRDRTQRSHRDPCSTGGNHRSLGGTLQGRRPLGHMSQTPCSKPTPSFEALVSVYCAKRPGQSLFFIAFSSAFRGAVRPGQTPLGHMSQTLRTAVGCYPDSILVSAVAIGRAVPIKRHHPSLQDQYLKLRWSFSSHPLPHLRTCLAPSHAPHLRAPLQAFARVGSTTPRPSSV